ncbi:fatty acid--CoA ligase [Sporosarcina sp. FSL W7-1349]|uniref:fatty acid--CoA ligase n=1 Tax=Sporosarcina sp. FSL W7-1349 TaxID=2921561 RepID=UPI0030F4B587
MYATVGKIFDLTVQKYPDREAIVDLRKGIRWTYGEWGTEVNRLANAFADASVEKGDRVSAFLFNASELASTLFATAKIGAVFNPINFRLKPKELAYILKDAEPKILLFESALEETVSAIRDDFPDIQFWFIDDQAPAYAESFGKKVRNAASTPPDVDVDENDLYAIMYTSGTTGHPKGVMHRHRAMAEQSLICITALKCSKNDRGLVIAPMFHCAELHCNIIPRVQSGAANIIMHQFNPKEALRVIEEEKITILFAAPTMWNMMLQEDVSTFDVRSLRRGLYGAAPMAPVLVKELQRVLNIDLVQAYGQTEMGPAITFLTEEDQISKAGSAGQACHNHEIRVVRPSEDGPADPDDILPPGEVGEIIVQGPCMMIGYFNRSEATEDALAHGWYHSGDLGYFDQDGYLFVADRVDDMVISGGENIYPREVEDVLYEHEAVLDVAVLGVPDEKWGERVMAVVVSKDPDLTADELEDFCKNHEGLAAYKRPRSYSFVDALPRNASGKIQKFLLREQLVQSVK